MGLNKQVGRDRIFDIATHYGLYDPGVEFRWRRDFSTLSDPPCRQYNGYRVIISGVKWPGSGFYCPSPPSSGVKEVRGLYFTPFLLGLNGLL